MLKTLRPSLQKDGYGIDQAYDSKTVLDKMRRNIYNLVIIGAAPSLGLAVCQQLREISNIPIIMLSGNDNEMEEMLSLEYGADDYLKKPFNVLIIKARIKAIFRRARIQSDANGARVKKGVHINAAIRSAWVDSTPISLSPQEFEVLKLLMEHPGEVMRREDLFKVIWGGRNASSRIVDEHIRRLREKIEADPSLPKYIKAKRGVGYCYYPDE